MDFPAFPDAPPLFSEAEKLEMASAKTGAKRFRELINEKTKSYDDLFHDLYPIDKLVKGLSRLYDEVMQAAWQRAGLDLEKGVAMIAVGGYGPGRASPEIGHRPTHSYSRRC